MTAHAAFWPQRLPFAISPPVTSLWVNLEISAKRYPDKLALVFMGRTWTYAELQYEAEKLAGYLATLGVCKGDRVVLNMQNCPQLVIAHFAILRLDAVVVPVNPMNRMEELKHYITDPDARVAITTADLAPELAGASDALAPEQQLRHLVVTQFTDVFDPVAAGPENLPAHWHDWLVPVRALPALAHGQVHAWTQAVAQDLPLPAVTATSREQLDDLYLALTSHPMVKIVL